MTRYEIAGVAAGLTASQVQAVRDELVARPDAIDTLRKLDGLVHLCKRRPRACDADGPLIRRLTDLIADDAHAILGRLRGVGAPDLPALFVGADDAALLLGDHAVCSALHRAAVPEAESAYAWAG